MIIRTNFIKEKSGQSIVEIIIALALFVIIIAAFTSLLFGSLNSLERSDQIVRADGLTKEAYEALRLIKSRAWNELTYDRSAIEIVNNTWQQSGEGTSEQIGMFSRTINWSPVYRLSDGSLSTASNPNAYLDVMSREAIITVSWPIVGVQTRAIEWQTYFSNFEALVWEQSDWQAGDGQTIWSDIDKYFNADKINITNPGEISLAEISTTSLEASGWLESSAFNTLSNQSFSAVMWEESIPPSCTDCRVLVQIKTAPDDSGSPGAWSSTWCGIEGEDGDETDYFSVSTGELIHTDHNGDEWVKYRVLLEGDGSETPILERILFYYQ